MALIRTESEVDKLIEDMVKRSKGRYITQGVSFNKDSDIHLMLLKMVLMSASSFGAFVRELLSKEFHTELTNKHVIYNEVKTVEYKPQMLHITQPQPALETNKTSGDFGNFL